MAVIYRPKHRYQLIPTDPYGGVNCTAYSMSMAIDRATLGGSKVSGERIRALSSEPKPNPGSPGLNIDQACDVAQYLGVALSRHRGGTWRAIADALEAAKGVVLAIDYDAMGTYSCQKSFLDFHAVFVNNPSQEGKVVLLYDPLCPTGPRYVPTATVRKAAEKYGTQTGGLYWAATRTTPNVPSN